MLNSAHGVVGKVVSGWEIAGVGRVQSGTPHQHPERPRHLQPERGGVVLHNITAKQLQSMMA